MITKRSIQWILGMLWLVGGVSCAGLEPGVALTIYNDNFGVVKERRLMGFEKGLNTMEFTGVASAIDPTSVKFSCLTSPEDVAILEQNYEYDLVNTASLLKRYIDQDVAVVLKGSGASQSRMVDGILLSAMGNDLILDEGGEGRMMILDRDSIDSIRLSEKPEGLVTRPTLVWLARARKQAEELCQVTYTTEQIQWQADYTAVLNETEDALDLSGWVTVNNRSGATYKDATIKLIAGDVRRIQPPRQPEMAYDMSVKLAAARGAGEGFEEKAFMEYHLYTLGRKSTINNNQVKQIELIDPAMGVPVEKMLVYQVGERTWWERNRSDKVQIQLEFENKEEYQLGIALPKGKVRVFKKDPADGTLEFVGEDTIDHTARKEKLNLYIGDAFDVVAEYKTVKSQGGDRWRQQSHEVEVRNRKEAPVSVYVEHRFGKWLDDWKISDASHTFEQKDAWTVRFQVDVKADATVTLRYNTRESW